MHAGLAALVLLAGTPSGVLAATAPAIEMLGASPEIRMLLPEVAQRICAGGIDTPPTPEASLIAGQPFSAPDASGEARGWQAGPGLLLRIARLDARQGGTLFFIDAYAQGATPQEGLRPLMRAVINGRCQLLGGQDVLYDAAALAAHPVALQGLGPDMQADRPLAPLNPLVPEGTADPNCLRIAVLDNGVNYLLPNILPRLARDADGALVGHDYWEDDDRPFDYGYPLRSLDPRISPFSPRRHGTGVASVLLSEAPANACVAPYRYTPVDMPGGGSDPVQMIADMAADGIRIVNLSSGREQPWPEFLAAMEAHPEILFVLAAGNEARDLAAQPSYPAAYRLDNVIVVAATTTDGALWPQSNYGAVDLAVPAVDLAATVADGSTQELTGTSLAAPRVAALAATLLAASPNATAAELKQAILDQASASGVEAGGVPVLTDAQLAAQ